MRQHSTMSPLRRGGLFLLRYTRTGCERAATPHDDKSPPESTLAVAILTVFEGHLALIGEETAHNLSLQVSPEKFKLLPMLENESTKLFRPIVLVCQIKENWGGATETSHCSEIQPLFSLCYYVYRRHVSRWEVIYTCLRMKMSTRCSHVYAQHSSWQTFFKIKTNYSMESTYSCSYIWLP